MNNIKITEILNKGSSIQRGEISLFIADKDFELMGLPVLKNSLVFYNGQKRIWINTLNFALFWNRPDLVNANLSLDIKSRISVKKATDCTHEITKIKKDKNGLWHVDHFDEWESNYSDYIERIKSNKNLEYNGIKFSSLAYEFNIDTRKLEIFVNTEPITLELNNNKITLPELLLIYRGNEGNYTILPLNENVIYKGYELEKSFIFVSNDGNLEGTCARDTNALIDNYPGSREIIVGRYTDLEISSNGKTFIRLFNPHTRKVEKFNIHKINK